MRHRRHVFVCVQRRSGGGKPACGDRGGRELLVAVERLLAAHPDARIGATGTECLGPCFDGPSAVVYPEGTWYGGLAASDAAGLVEGVLPADRRHPWSDDDDDAST